MSELFLDYREQVQKILDELDDTQTSLRLGAVAIKSLLELAQVEYDSDQDGDDDDDDDSDKDEDADSDEDDSTDTDADGADETADNLSTEGSQTDFADPAEAEASASGDAPTRQVKIISPASENAPVLRVNQDFAFDVPTGHEVCKFIRCRTGGSLIDARRAFAGKISEATVRNLGLANGNIVEAKPEKDDKVTIIRVLNTVETPDNLSSFDYGIVEEELDGSLFVDHNASGERLSDFLHEERYKIPDGINASKSAKGYVKAGDIVNLAWYKNEPSSTLVRWVIRDGGGSFLASKPTAVKRKEKEQNNKEEKNKSIEAKPDVSTLAFDLKGRKIGVVIGNELRRNEIQHMVEEHNGTCRIVNAFKFGEPESFYKHELKHVDIAVLVQNINKHSTSKLVRKYAKRFAIADSAGLSAIERAIYRAMYGLPAYETSTQPIAYPVKDAANA